MNNLVREIARERTRLQKQLDGLNAAARALGATSSNGRRGRHKLSKAARAKIAKAQKERWAKLKKGGAN